MHIVRWCPFQVPFLDAIFGSLMPALSAIAVAQPSMGTSGRSPLSAAAAAAAANGAGASAATDERLYAFEAAGLLLCQETIDPEAQAGMLRALLSPLIGQARMRVKEGSAQSMASNVVRSCGSESLASPLLTLATISACRYHLRMYRLTVRSRQCPSHPRGRRGRCRSRRWLRPLRRRSTLSATWQRASHATWRPSRGHRCATAALWCRYAAASRHNWRPTRI